MFYCNYPSPAPALFSHHVSTESKLEESNQNQGCPESMEVAMKLYSGIRQKHKSLKCTLMPKALLKC